MCVAHTLWCWLIILWKTLWTTERGGCFVWLCNQRLLKEFFGRRLNKCYPVKKRKCLCVLRTVAFVCHKRGQDIVPSLPRSSANNRFSLLKIAADYQTGSDETTVWRHQPKTQRWPRSSSQRCLSNGTANGWALSSCQQPIRNTEFQISRKNRMQLGCVFFSSVFEDIFYCVMRFSQFWQKMLPLVIKSSTGKKFRVLKKESCNKIKEETKQSDKQISLQTLHCALWLSLGP